MPKRRRLKTFISHSHEDKPLLAEFKKHLKEHFWDTMDIFTDSDISPGKSIFKAIKEALDNADLAIFLFTPDFLASDYCKWEWEEAIRQGKVCIPVIVKDCAWKEVLTGEHDFKALPHNGRPVMDYPNRDDAWAEVCTGIRVSANEIKVPVEEFVSPSKEGLPVAPLGRKKPLLESPGLMDLVAPAQSNGTAKAATPNSEEDFGVGDIIRMFAGVAAAIFVVRLALQ